MKGSYLNDGFFSRLETLSLNLKTSLSGYFGGKHLVSTYGQTVEFADFREYQLGDDIRRIDWNLYSRFEKYFLKLFTDERQMQIQVFLDCSASMGNSASGKGAYALATAAALGFLAVHNMDKLSFNLMKGNKSENPFGNIIGKQAFFRAIGQMQDVTFDDEVDIDSCVTSCTDAGTANGLSVIVSDFFTDNWKKAVDYLCYKRRQVMLVQVLSPEEIDPAYDGRVNLIDSESVDVSDSKNMRIRITRSMQAAYAQAFADFRAGIADYCKKRSVDFISVQTNKPIERALFGELLKAGIMA
ncbi:MAG: DUF58 domain-containing protein [Firmicutes bacterium]|nr:DUF58 domain-containing protein [Bacillota bacterium]MDY5530680.1 DUF58 domain-containing protein [Pumilibacteraceae bacterium]